MSEIDIRLGDALTVLQDMPDESVHCVVTSPPYWGLRDYGVDGQIGLEASLGEHMAVLVTLFREVRRVLRKDGTCWVNYGDAYASAPNGRSAADTKAAGNDDRTFRDKPISTVGGVIKPKDLCMLPNRLAIALQDDGWWVRSEIVWNKTNPKPESAKDRPAAVHEKIWLLTKSQKYFFDPEPLKEPVSGNAHARRKDGQYLPAKGSTAGNNRAGTWVETYVPEMRNGRNVWTFNIEGMRDAHFATFPQELAKKCILAGCPVGGVVLDPFFGAGTTGLVAAKHGRDCIGIELNPTYVEIAQRRLGLPFGVFA